MDWWRCCCCYYYSSFKLVKEDFTLYAMCELKGKFPVKYFGSPKAYYAITKWHVYLRGTMFLKMGHPRALFRLSSSF